MEIHLKNGSYIKSINSKSDNKRSKGAYEQQIKFWKDNPDLFIEEYFGIKLFPYQKNLLKRLGGKDMSKIIVNGQAYNISSGANIAINDGQVFVNGENITVKNIPNVEVKIEGNINSLKTNGDVTVLHGNVRNISCGGDCCVYDLVEGSINADGDVKCNNVYGSINAGGDVLYG